MSINVVLLANEEITDCLSLWQHFSKTIDSTLLPMAAAIFVVCNIGTGPVTKMKIRKFPDFFSSKSRKKL
jgi:hypothetical protein